VRSELRRLRSIAQRRGLCPTHLTKLTCGCDRRWTWTGTPEQWAEYSGLISRVDHIYATLFVYGTCQGCGIERYCEPCGRERLAQGPNPFTEEEMERMLALMERLQPREPDHAP
jgi:hypothetical protein